jgi:isopenicillin-N N-acyltransferase-like protein
MSYPHIRVAGNAGERGRAYGEAAHARVQRSLAGYERAFAAHAGLSWPRAREMAERYVPAIERHAQGALAEMEGIAAGAGVDPEDILALNARTEVIAAAWAREATTARATDGCTALAVLPGRSRDGHTLLAQNWDWMVHVVDTVVVLEAERDDGPAFVTAVEAGLLAKTGLNAAGLGLATNFLLTADDDGRTGVPYHVTLRALLDARSVPEALERLGSMERSSSANYLLADASGRAVDVEAAPGDGARLYRIEPEDGLLAHTNHFCTEATRALDAGAEVVPSSPLRLQRVRDLVGAPAGSAEIRAALADHENFPAAVCCHPDPDLDEAERDITALSIVMDLDARRVELADGNPCETPYRTLDYADLLAPA